MTREPPEGPTGEGRAGRQYVKVMRLTVDMPDNSRWDPELKYRQPGENW